MIKVTLKLYDEQPKDYTIQSNTFRLGRSEINEIKISHEGLSRNHCLFEMDENNNLYVTDLNSTNGVFLDGIKVPPNERILFPSYLRLSVGPIESMQYFLDNEQIGSGIVSLSKSSTTIVPQTYSKKVLQETMGIAIKKHGNSSAPTKIVKPHSRLIISLMVGALIIVIALVFTNFDSADNTNSEIYDQSLKLESEDF